jgi:hypothetical protein
VICAYCGGETDVAAITPAGPIPVPICIDCMTPVLRQDLARALDGMDAGEEYYEGMPDAHLHPPDEGR